MTASLDDDFEGLAAEYVLGTLDYAERKAADMQRQNDSVLDRAISAWEQRLSPLLDTIPAVTPDAGLYRKIEQRLNAAAIIPFPVRPDAKLLQRRVAQWRGLALAASLAACLAVGVAFNATSRHQQLGLTLVAALQKDSAAPAFLVGFDEQAKSIKIVAMQTAFPVGKDYELWLIADSLKAPRSMGVMNAQTASLQPDLNGLTPHDVRDATMAVSIEPTGGSPTGAPTGPVVFTGKFIAAKL